MVSSQSLKHRRREYNLFLHTTCLVTIIIILGDGNKNMPLKRVDKPQDGQILLSFLPYNRHDNFNCRSNCLPPTANILQKRWLEINYYIVATAQSSPKQRNLSVQLMCLPTMKGWLCINCNLMVMTRHSFIKSARTPERVTEKPVDKNTPSHTLARMLLRVSNQRDGQY